VSKNLLSKYGLRPQPRGLVASVVVFSGGLIAAIVSLMLISAEVSADSEPKRIVLIGATAKSAPALISQALEAGHDIIGIARRPEAVKITHERFTVLKGDVYDLESIENALTGDEVVISYLGIFPNPNVELEEINLFSKGTANIIQAMHNKGNRRLIVASQVAAGYVVVDKPPNDAPTLDKVVWNWRRKYDDVRRMEVLVKSSDLDYIMIRPAQLIGRRPSRGTYKIVLNEADIQKILRDVTPRRSLARTDLAAFILDQLDSDEYLGMTIGLYN